MANPYQYCGKPGPCDWCDTLQLTEDILWFKEGQPENYEGEAYDRGRRIAVALEDLQFQIAGLCK